MSGVKINSEVFARLVGHNEDRCTLLFEVSPQFLDRAESQGWSEPVRYRFERCEGAKVELVMRCEPEAA